MVVVTVSVGVGGRRAPWKEEEEERDLKYVCELDLWERVCNWD